MYFSEKRGFVISLAMGTAPGT